MVHIAAVREDESEPRVALSPDTVKKYVALGCRVHVETGAGARSFFLDADYEAAGATVVPTSGAALDGADLVLKVRAPNHDQIAAMKNGAVIVAMLDPFAGDALARALTEKNISGFAMELMPRVTRAQSMDVLSSQSNLAGYKAVINAAARFGRALPMMMTAAGTVAAGRVFVMGAGVAGLQAIATARRLGAVVSATDVRPAAKEQVKSLGAKFIAVEDDEFREAETAGGYAKEMSSAYKQKQAELIAEHIKTQDIIITTALIPGRPAPKLVTRDMVETMKPGAVIVDMAAERGGNCEVTQPGAEILHHGVCVMGPLNLAGEIPGNASSLYARNLHAFAELIIDRESGQIRIDWNDDIIKGTGLTRDGQIVHPMLAGETV